MGLRAAPTEDTGVSAAEIVFGALLVLPGQILDTEEPPPADFIAKLRQSGPPPPSRPLSYAQMAANPPAALLSAAFVYVRKGGTVPPLLPLYSGPYRVLASGQRCSRYRWASGRRRYPSTALSRTGGRSSPASTAVIQRPATSWLIVSSHPLPQGLSLARGPVAEQMHEFSYMKNPPKCVCGNLRIISCQYFNQSIVSTPA
jgi:hypothetical protein